ncbi:MAG: mechanosensitive ion channel family protein [Balneolaceae bacterium]|nr:mechanosensitive ion channel family protein [Balneolaceae bacterium]
MEDIIANYTRETWQLSLVIGVILTVTIVIGLVTTKLFNVYIEKNRKDEDTDLTSIVFLKRAVLVLIYISGISFALYLIPQFRIIGGSLLASAGVLALAVGFASQQALSNIIGGVFIVIFKPYRINDRINLKTDLSGIVEDINLRHTVIRNYENKRIIIPNSVISNEVLINSNYEDDLICKWIDIGISYDADIDKARAIMQEEIQNHPSFLDNRTPEQIEEGEDIVPVRVLSLGDFSVNLRAWSWAMDQPTAFKMGCDLLETIKKRFDDEGLEIPFPYRTVVYKKDLEEKGRGLPLSQEKGKD